ncbi:phosphate transport system regulatory protein PhoU [bacterium]|nr:phosphate transport system regulatory protein PhoU [bacterium]NBW99542.1 phosphate transport system regulatory protein PhoU [bacterium]NBX82268.1 phosphate transport system regulatory protein PhoU [bacterium]
MQRSIDIGLNELKAQLVQMAGYLEEAVKNATLAWRNRSREMIERVNAIEDKVNQAHLDVDAACLKLLATQQPLATDLRFILSVVKTNSDIERMADQAVNISNNAVYYLQHPPYQDLSDLIRMSEIVRELVKNAIDAFIKEDAVLAQNVLDADDEVDQLKNKVFKDVLAHLKQTPQEVEQGLNVILIARNLERIGDHATNIAEDVIFTISGQDVRHSHFRKKGSPDEK